MSHRNVGCVRSECGEMSPPNGDVSPRMGECVLRSVRRVPLECRMCSPGNGAYVLIGPWDVRPCMED
jgi:hypothetical protein